MHDRAVRRRRAVLAVLVTASLILLTAYFGESSNGRLHSVQRGALGVLSPVQEGASRVLKPFRDLFGWFGDTVHAKGQRDQYRKEAAAYRLQVAQMQYQLDQAQQQAGLDKADTEGGMSQYGPVDARVFVRSPSSWFQHVTINKGTNDGVHPGDPVINGEGLVGKIFTATGGDAIVTLITDQEFAASGITGLSHEPGSVTPAVGSDNDLNFSLVEDAGKVRTNELVLTAGTTDSKFTSPYPHGILIGTVKKIDRADGALDPTIHIQPAVDVRRVDRVQVLTQPHSDLSK